MHIDANTLVLKGQTIKLLFVTEGVNLSPPKKPLHKKWRRRKTNKIPLGEKRELFENLYAHHSAQCNWCGETVSPESEEKGGHNYLKATIDHLKSNFLGRKDYMDGGHVLSCKRCNGTRGGREYRDWQLLPTFRRLTLTF